MLFDGADAEGFGGWAEAAHAGDLCVDVEVFAAFAAEVFAGDDGVAAGAQAVSDDAVGDGDAELVVALRTSLVAEEGWGVVHQDMEATQAGERGVERGLIAGEEGFRRGAGWRK